ncbi:MAG: hypothetical protein FOGNACKC_03170 [Anaerolineae bacterium]|nr:hypothetical protein [Anaerolineae bacterium]
MPQLFTQTQRRIAFALLLLLGLAFFTALHLDLLKVGTANPGAAAGMMENEEDEAATIEQYFQWRFDQMKDESGQIPDGALIEALNDRKAMVAAQPSPDSLSALEAGITNTSWTYAGPGNVGGRIRAILPINSSTVFIGSVSGGLWKTTNCCSTSTTWSPIDDWMANLAISSLIVHPTNANVMYAGTGEGFNNADAIRGAGVFKSTDGGATWTQLPSTNNSDWHYVNRLAISPDGNNLLAATRTGLYHSADGGTSWTRRVTGNWLDVKFDPTLVGSNNAVAGGNGYSWYTTGGGASGTWTKATGLPTSGRVELAYAPSNPSIVYASVDKTSGEVYKSTDGGQSYVLVNSGTGYLGSQGYYDNTIWVKPNDPNTIVVGGIDLYKSIDGGATLTQISKWNRSWYYRNPPSPHADHHALVSIPGSSTALLNGNDGGIYYTGNIATAGNNPDDYNNGWVYMNNNLGITQFYGVAGNYNGVLLGGTQDNGQLTYTPTGGANGWTYAFGGDGGKSAADPTDPNYFYNEYIFGQVRRNSNGGAGTGEYIWGTYAGGCRAAPYVITDACNGQGSFIAPILLDPNNANRLFVGDLSLWVSNDVKTPYVYNSPTGGPQWTAIKPSTGSGISAIAVAPGDSNVIWVGYKNSHIEMTTDGGTNWTPVDTNIPAANNPGTQVSSIAIDRNESNIVYVGFTGFYTNTALSNLWRTADGGTTWTSIMNNLPQVPIYAVAINPANSDWLYVGTEIGVFASENTGATWNVPTGTGKNGDGPANVAVEDLQWMGGGNSTGSTILIAGTHGRGAWTADTMPPAYTDTYASPTLACLGNSPCYPTIGEALANVATGGTVTIYAGTYAENVTSALKTVTVNVAGNITVNDLSLYNGSTWNAGSYAITVDNFNLFGGTWNANSSTLTVNGDWTTGGTFNTGTGTVIFAKAGTVTLSDPAQTEGTTTFCNLTISAGTTVDVTDDFIGVSTGAGCGAFTQNGQLRREAPQQTVVNYDTYTYKDARNRDSVILTKMSGNSLYYTNITITSNQQPPACNGTSLTTPVLRQFDLTSSGGTAPYGPYRMRLYFSANNPNEANGNTVTAPYNLAIYHCNGASWEKYAGIGGSDANGVYVESTAATWSAGSTFAIGPYANGTIYYSQGNFDAGALTSWKTTRDGIGGASPASFTDSDIFVIQTGHSMTTASALTLSHADSLLLIESGGALTASAFDVSVMGAQVDTGGTLTVNSGRTLTVNNGSRAPDLSVNGTVVNYSSNAIAMNGTAAFGAGSVYQHAVNGGTIPTATWDVASTVLVTGVTTTVPTLASLTQSFGNFTWNSPNQTGDISLSGWLGTVKGNFTVTSTKSGSVRLANSLASGTVNVGGNVLVNGGTLYVSGSTGAVTLNVGGNLTVSSGTFYFSGGTATPTVNVTGNVVLNGGLLRPSISTGASILNVAGDWTYNTGATFTPANSTVNFTKNGVATVSSAAAQGTLTFNNLTISTTTTVDVTDDFISVTGGYTQNGKLRRQAPAQNLNTTGLFTFKDGRNRDTVTLQKLGGNDLGSTSITITSNQSPVCGSSTLATLALRQFDIAPTGTGPFSQTLKLYFSPANPDESNGLTSPYNLSIYHCNGTSWESYSGASGTDANGVYVQADVNSFSTFAVGPQIPTAITLASFAAVQGSGGVTVTWQTGTEIDNAGFNLHRATSPAGPYTRVNPAIIPAKGEAVSGASYTYFDAAATEANTVYYYKLEDIDTSGISTFRGPVDTASGTTGNPDGQRIFLPVITKSAG